jgi:hypothetical protein
MEIPEPVHLCIPPARADLTDFWRCDCGAEWLYVHYLQARIPDWVRINGRAA